MQDWVNLVEKVGVLLGSLISVLTLVNAMTKTKNDIKKDSHDDMRTDAEFYRQRWLDAEQGYDQLEAENKHLRNKIKSLENKLNSRGNKK